MATPLSSALHLCQRIREEYSHISVEHLCRFAINRQQCMLLSNKVLEAENTLKPIQVKLSQQDTTSSGFPNVEGSSPEGGNLSASRVSTSIQEEDSDQERFKLGRLEEKNREARVQRNLTWREMRRKRQQRQAAITRLYNSANVATLHTSSPVSPP
ncbi:unnamed protein product [Sphagnum jensenii]|uniref:Uncharacterized protein n=1 Tax=Sphagnum jensenii TaxID=128206 RepID=A0ABP0X284_9BRYO